MLGTKRLMTPVADVSVPFLTALVASQVENHQVSVLLFPKQSEGVSWGKSDGLFLHKVPLLRYAGTAWVNDVVHLLADQIVHFSPSPQNKGR